MANEYREVIETDEITDKTFFSVRNLSFVDAQNFFGKWWVILVDTESQV